MAAETLLIPYKPHPRQQEVHDSRSRFRVVVKGRQSGGTLLAVVEIALYAMSHSRVTLWWVTSSYRTKDKAWRELTRVTPSKIIRKKHEGELYIELRNGSRISIKSADAPESLVSETLHGVVLDEFAQYSDVIWPMHLQPMLATTGGWALFVGAPRGLNWAHDLFQRGVRGEDGWASFRWASIESPYVSRDDVERAQRELPDRIFRQEWEAEFVEGGGSVFRGVDGCIGPVGEADGYTVMGADLAKLRDWTVLHVLNSARQTVYRVRFQKLDYGLQKTRIIETYHRLGCTKLVIDATGLGDPIVDDLMRAGLTVEPVKFTSESKANVIEHLMLQFDQGAIRIPPDEDLIAELRAFSFETLPSGNDRYSAPSGKHDDAVIALALAAWGLRGIPMTESFPPVSRQPTLQDWIRKDIENITAQWRGGTYVPRPRNGWEEG